MTKNPSRIYHRIEAISATKIGQVVLLLDHCGRLLAQAKTAIKENKIEERYQTLDQVLVILNTLQNSLDVSNSSYARDVFQFLQTMSLGILEVQLKNNADMCEKIQKCLQEMAKIWRKGDMSPQIPPHSSPLNDSSLTLRI